MCNYIIDSLNFGIDKVMLAGQAQNYSLESGDWRANH